MHHSGSLLVTCQPLQSSRACLQETSPCSEDDHRTCRMHDKHQYVTPQLQTSLGSGCHGALQYFISPIPNR
ncbi:hypothetical protein BDV26DRAFT_254952 [Aspergillus bertholletiae]|uniref:Uncharacterized protein n=1 Tax=Aspergillus bertholletiae TaxID=1226010 RepID=A0A5N7BIR9_9EURO|nr:hypothetical protein BDV26DRAFT_254952 [Aspergillus bertholletiae]